MQGSYPGYNSADDGAAGDRSGSSPPKGSSSSGSGPSSRRQPAPLRTEVPDKRTRRVSALQPHETLRKPDEEFKRPLQGRTFDHLSNDQFWLKLANKMPEMLKHLCRSSDNLAAYEGGWKFAEKHGRLVASMRKTHSYLFEEGATGWTDEMYSLYVLDTIMRLAGEEALKRASTKMRG